MSDIDIDHLRQWIGREETAAETLTPELVVRFNATFDAATAEPAIGAPAPRMIHWCLAQPAAPMSQLGPDGHPARGGFLPPVPLPRRMWAGGALTFTGDIPVGARVERRSRITDVVLKHGSTGPLCFVTVAHRVCVGSQCFVEERQDIVYRGAESGGSGSGRKPPEPAAHGATRVRIEPSAPLMFRYSALTFNGHSIHYDRRYCIEVEGYPGLVFHGPLQATLLYRLATDVGSTAPKQLEFRSLSPLFDDHDVWLNAEPAGAGKLKLWTARDGGPVAMTAEAQW